MSATAERGRGREGDARAAQRSRNAHTPTPPHAQPSEHKDFSTIEAEKEARTPSPEEWLAKAATIPVKNL